MTVTTLDRLVLCDYTAPLSLTITAPAAAITAAAVTDPARRIAGLALPFGVAGQTSAGPLTVNAGTVQLPSDLRRVKLFTEHGRTTPVGYATEATESDAGLTMAFRVGATPSGDSALIEAAEGIRDALSVELSNVTVTDGVVTAAELVAVVLTSVPAFADARIAAHRADPPGTAPAPAPPAPAAGGMIVNVSGGALPAELSAARRPAVAFQAVVPALAAAIRDNDIGRVNAALSDVVPGNDTGGGFMGTGQWVGELWTPIAEERHYWPRVQHSPLTSGLKVYGWKWETLPQVGVYAGNKAAIPSNPVTIVPAEAPIVRYAGGWDIDRIFIDLGDPGFLEAFFRAAAVDLGNKLEAALGAAMVAAAGEGQYAADVYAAISLAVRTLLAAGARPASIALASDVYAVLVDSPRADSPWWLPEQARIQLGAETGNLTDLAVFLDPTLPAGAVLAWDSRAVTGYEASPLPIRVQAVNIPNGGIDLGVFAYASTIVNDDRGIALVTVGTDPTP
jgi:HK97 family phage prohead protease